MKCDNISRAVVIALVVAATLPTQATPVQGRRLPTFEVERMWRNAKLGEIGAGTNEIRQLLIARELFGMR